jgi:hypothetical protein
MQVPTGVLHRGQGNFVPPPRARVQVTTSSDAQPPWDRNPGGKGTRRPLATRAASQATHCPNSLHEPAIHTVIDPTLGDANDSTRTSRLLKPTLATHGNANVDVQVGTDSPNNRRPKQPPGGLVPLPQFCLFSSQLKTHQQAGEHEP